MKADDKRLKIMSMLIECENLSKSYQSRAVLNGISLSIPAGKRIALMGPSGSGKSTLLNCLGGVDRFDTGSILIGGVRLEDADADTLSRLRRKTVGTVFQFFHLLPTLSVWENIAFPLLLNGVSSDTARQKAFELAERVQLGARAHAFPDQLSGGEMQRCAIARALASSPQILLADEPTGNLDSVTGETILDLLDTLTREANITLVMVTHSEAATRICDEVLHLLDGRLLENSSRS